MITYSTPTEKTDKEKEEQQQEKEEEEEVVVVVGHETGHEYTVSQVMRRDMSIKSVSTCERTRHPTSRTGQPSIE
jgi:hypothetical protein